MNMFEVPFAMMMKSVMAGGVPPAPPAGARQHAVPGDSLRVHPEAGCAVRDEGVRLDEAAGIEQQTEPLPRGQLPLLVLRLNPIFAPAFSGLGLPSAQLIDALIAHHGAAERGARH